MGHAWVTEDAQNSTCTFVLTGGFDDNYSLDTCERYSPKTQKWESVFRLSCPRGGVGLAALGGRLYAVGGHDGKNYLNSVEAYDPLTDRLVYQANVKNSLVAPSKKVLVGFNQQLK